MTLGIALAFAILTMALVIFALELFPIDFVAFAILALILVLGPMLGVKPAEAISGFSNPATITVMAMFILSGGINRTGIINLLAQRMVRLAGGTELLPDFRRGLELRRALIALDGIDELRGIAAADGQLRSGAMANMENLPRLMAVAMARGMPTTTSNSPAASPTTRAHSPG